MNSELSDSWEARHRSDAGLHRAAQEVASLGRPHRFRRSCPGSRHPRWVLKDSQRKFLADQEVTGLRRSQLLRLHRPGWLPESQHLPGPLA